MPDCTLEATSPATPLQFLPLLAPGVVSGVVKDTIFAIDFDDVAVFQFAKYTIIYKREAMYLDILCGY